MLLKLKYIPAGEPFCLPSGETAMKLEMSRALATCIAAGLYHKGIKDGEYALIYFKDSHQLEITSVEDIMSVEYTPSVN